MNFRLLDRDFSMLGLHSRKDIESTLKEHPQPLSGYTFATLVCWTEVYHYGWARLDDGTLLISGHFGDPAQRYLIQPLGAFTPAAQTHLVTEGRKLPYPLKLYGVNAAFLEAYPEFVSHFDVQDDRATANYIYAAADLATLPGRKYFKKRNLLSQASREYTHTTEPLTAQNALECLELAESLPREDGVELTETLAHEMSSLRCTLRHVEALQQNGVVVRIDGKLAAFSVFEELRPGEAVQHFEKARRGHKGIYQVINKETSSAIHALGYTLVNREEDLGNEGLRQAKMTYFPVEIRPSHVLTLRPG